MSLIRPELSSRLTRWREPLFCGVVGGLGIILIAGVWFPAGLLPFVAGSVLVAGAGAMLPGAVRRVRFGGLRPAGGVVVADEGRIGYLGPLGGGFVDLSGLERVEFAATGGGRTQWRLVGDDGTELIIPAGAKDADQIPDILAALPGLDMSAAMEIVAASESSRTRTEVLWSRG